VKFNHRRIAISCASVRNIDVIDAELQLVAALCAAALRGLGQLVVVS
jgi:hypothetical protein